MRIILVQRLNFELFTSECQFTYFDGNETSVPYHNLLDTKVCGEGYRYEFFGHETGSQCKGGCLANEMTSLNTYFNIMNE